MELLETKYFLEAVDEYPDTFLIIDIDPIVFDDKKNLYFITLYCYDNVMSWILRWTYLKDSLRTFTQGVNDERKVC